MRSRVSRQLAQRFEGAKAADGTRIGDQIPGSRYVRSFCWRCREPMRVQPCRLETEMYCGDCDPPHMGVGSPRGSLNGVDRDRDAFTPATMSS